MAAVKSKKEISLEPKRSSVRTGRNFKQKKISTNGKSHSITMKSRPSFKWVEVDPAKIPPSTTEEKKELFKILKEAEANGEIDLSEFCIPVEE